MSVSASVNFSSSLKLSTGESGSCSSPDWLSTSHSEDNNDNDSYDHPDDNNLKSNDANIRAIRQMSDLGGDNIVGSANIAYYAEQHDCIEISPNHVAMTRSRQRPTNNQHIT